MKHLNLDLFNYLEKKTKKLFNNDKLNVNLLHPLDPLKDFSDLKKTEPVLLKGGIYFYFYNERLLYIGKAKKLESRLKSHNLEMHEEHNNCPVFWQVYFNLHNDENLKLYVLEVQDEIERNSLESFLQRKLKPEFDFLKNLMSNKSNPRLKPKSKEYKIKKNEIIEFVKSQRRQRSTPNITLNK